ncbi:MAG: methyltransferase domain-containing protein [Candidatus Brocadiales bacterium]|nr:methyltransferase domain-containing protein [Candidatus Brocadiales bacterium]
MERIVEKELMDDPKHAITYANADFEKINNRVIEIFDIEFPDIEIKGTILDLGCGPGDITFRFAKHFPGSTVIGIDGAAVMIELANRRKGRESEFVDNITFIEAEIPAAPIPGIPFDLIVSNSLYHHLHDPEVLWKTILDYGSSGTKIFIVDLFRPDSKERADWLVNEYSGNEPEILKKDFYNSLCASFEPAEVEQQLSNTGLTGLSVKIVSDRHLIVCGEVE